jgi:hypothetical protein
LLKGIAKKEICLLRYLSGNITRRYVRAISYQYGGNDTNHGFGAGKAQKYGQPFIDLIRRYVEEK